MIEKLESLGFNNTVSLDPILAYIIEKNDYDIYLQVRLNKNNLKLQDISVLSSIKKTTNPEEIEKMFSEFIVDLEDIKNKYKEIIKLF